MKKPDANLLCAVFNQNRVDVVQIAAKLGENAIDTVAIRCEVVEILRRRRPATAAGVHKRSPVRVDAQAVLAVAVGHIVVEASKNVVRWSSGQAKLAGIDKMRRRGTNPGRWRW